MAGSESDKQSESSEEGQQSQWQGHSFETPAGAKVVWEDKDTAADWLENEAEKWKWLTKRRPPFTTNSFKWFDDKIDASFGKAIAVLRDSTTDSSNALQSAEKTMVSRWCGSGMPISDDPAGKVLLKTKNTYIDGAIAGALYLAQQTKDLPTLSQHIPLLIFGATLAAPYSKSGLPGIGAHEEAIKSALERSGELLESQAKATSNAQKELERVREDSKEKLEALTQEMRSIEKSYREHMNLKQASEYWRKLKSAYLCVGGLLTLVVAAAFLLATLYFIEVAPRFGPFIEDDTVSVIAIVKVAAIASFMVWGIRLLVRYWLSIWHAHRDAQYRQVMAETFVALTKDETLQPEDRKIVLASLFRHNSDGFVKDDALPTLSPHRFVSGP